ncbi:helix-turn-helix domain-containing protein [Paenibacillus polymyxa]|uniref:helix-turn-helix domain-containing protein n=1 Tax=Paenibacillus polymyxa TaxID=1406 RepID=UPI000AAA04BA|nr:hypothetical protein [Paenibacillus polymyxa]
MCQEQLQLTNRAGLYTNYVGQLDRGRKELMIETLEKIFRFGNFDGGTVSLS